MPSVGLRPVGAHVGEATWSFRCADGPRSEWPWVAGPPDPRSLQRVQETKSGRLSRNIPVQAMSTTTGGWLFLESGLEHELATWLDRERDVTWLARRLSHLLDQQPPMTASTRQIPQVLPPRLVGEYFAGLFDYRPATVGLFASLSIARTHPHVHSWADAARELGLPPELGERTARASSASITASPAAVVAALGAASRELEIDYRELEDRVRHLASTTRWFTDWARANRPGTRPISRAYAVQWQWLNVASG